LITNTPTFFDKLKQLEKAWVREETDTKFGRFAGKRLDESYFMKTFQMIDKVFGKGWVDR